VRAGSIGAGARELVLHEVEWVLRQYATACGGPPE